MAAAVLWGTTGTALVFVLPDAEPAAVGAVRIAVGGLAMLSMTDLRGEFLLARNVNPKIVFDMLGHASIGITLDTYSYVLPNMQQSAVRALEELLKSDSL